MYDKLQNAVRSIRRRTDFLPEVALVLGSGLGGFADKIVTECVIDYSDIEGLPLTGVEGHKGRLLFGTVGATRVVAMQGRVHYYEGYSMSDVVMPVRVMGLLGADKLVITNAAGGINPDFSPGTFMLIRDHIGFLVPSPLRGENQGQLGPRFPDMSEVYSRRLCNIIRSAAESCNVPLCEGVYAQLSGPNYETPAEIRALARLGADAVGMSVTCEAVAARHMGLKVCGISCITNSAAGVSDKPLSHDEVQQTADRVNERFAALLSAAIERMGADDEA